MIGGRGRSKVVIILILCAVLVYALLIWGAGRIDTSLASRGSGNESPEATVPNTGATTGQVTSPDDDISSGIPSDAENMPTPETTSEDPDDETTDPPATNSVDSPKPEPDPTSNQPTEQPTEGLSEPPPKPELPAPDGEVAQGSFEDPLGTGAEPGSLSEREQRRASIGAKHFVEAAYGFDGSNPDDYRMQLFLTVVQPDYTESPGGSLTDKLAGRVERGGVANQVTFDKFEFERKDGTRVEGVASFTLDEGSGMDRYEQQLQLVPWGAEWKVIHADKLKEK